MKKLNISHKYSIDLWSGSVCDQKDNERGWIYAPLNSIRQSVSKKLNMKQESFMLSAGYITFFDLFEKSMAFLEKAESADGNELNNILSQDISKNGDFNSFKLLSEKYGIVPLSAMPDAHCGHSGDYMLILNNRLRCCVKSLKEKAISKNEAAAEIIKALSEGLGTPPERFSFAYMDKTEKICKAEDITPIEFYRNYCPDLSEYEMLDVTDDNISKVKRAVISQLKAGEQVVIGADIYQQSNQMLGILDTDFNEPDNDLSKLERLKYQIIKPRHYISIDGAELDENGEAIRFKAQDSHGAETGADGHYTMSAKWFDEYVLKAVINKKYL